MGIISVSINDGLLEDIDDFMDEKGFSGRSEVVRTALRALLRERKELDRLKGETDALIIVTHKGHDSVAVDKIRHEYQHLTNTQFHNHLDDHKCLEVFKLQGEANEIRSFYEELQASDETEQAKIVIP